MAARPSPSEEECTCSVCCDIFTDPVLLLCGHSFCKNCIKEWWSLSRSKKCPVCKETCNMREPPRNLALRNLSEAVRTEQSSTAPEEMCAQHGEKLKLFCQFHQRPICVVCRHAREHETHKCVPIKEAAENHKIKLKIALMHLKTKLGTFNKVKLNNDKIASYIKVQALESEKQIKEEFRKLYQFLRAEEASRIDALRKEEIHKSQLIRTKIADLTKDISSLTEQIKTVEDEMKATDIAIMLNSRASMAKAQCSLPDPDTPNRALLDVAKHVGNLGYNIWKKMRTLIQYTPVILDPNTANPYHTVSRDLTSVEPGPLNKQIPNNPERYDDRIVGSKGIRSGSHTWDVQMRGQEYWAVGVITAHKLSKNPPRKIWCIYYCVCTDCLREETPEDYTKLLRESDAVPYKIRVQLDYDQGKLMFYDLDKKTFIHTITVTFTETVFPFLKKNGKILPVNSI